MLKAYTQPWFMDSCYLCAFLQVSGLACFQFLITRSPIALVDLGRWPKSIEWITMSEKFRSRHRIFVGRVQSLLCFLIS